MVQVSEASREGSNFETKPQPPSLGHHNFKTYQLTMALFVIGILPLQSHRLRTRNRRAKMSYHRPASLVLLIFCYDVVCVREEFVCLAHIVIRRDNSAHSKFRSLIWSLRGDKGIYESDWVTHRAASDAVSTALRLSLFIMIPTEYLSP